MTARNDDHRPAPAEAGEPTQVLESRGEPTQVLESGDEPTQVLESGDEPTRVWVSGDEPTQALESGVEQTPVLAAAGEAASTLHLGSDPTPHLGSDPTLHLGSDLTRRVGSAATLHLGPVDGPVDGRADGRAPSDAPPVPADAEYSATVLASHWIQRPGEDGTLVEQTLVHPSTENRPTPPDRVEGTVLRFGPGVTNAVAHRTHRTLPAVPPPPAHPRRRPRRHALPVLVVLCVLAFLAWQRLGPPLTVGTVKVTARPTVLGCEGTADLVALVTTNGRPGTLTYRWTRSDGTASGVLSEVMVRGQRQARLHLLWTFQGKGHRPAQAELRILTPAPRTATTRFTYDCR
ncbi:hypothetical protein [Streptomyces sp. NPDC012510]|uniref:hypothetical protein n=1 Tax=Streptomyces sp. NPDC012510 TaxID=3364838 RepID=UPI0036E4978A